MEPATRKVVQRSPAHTVRLLHLPYFQDDPIEAESSVERDFVHVAALHPRAVEIKHQPFKLTLACGTYTPDFLVRFRDGSKAVVEVKPESRVRAHEELFAQAREALVRHGLLFMVARDTMLRKEQMASRALKIRRYGKGGFSALECSRALELVSEGGEGLRMDRLLKAGVSRSLVLHLIAHRRLVTTPDLRIDDEALITLPAFSYTGERDAVCFARWLDA